VAGKKKTKTVKTVIALRQKKSGSKAIATSMALMALVRITPTPTRAAEISIPTEKAYSPKKVLKPTTFENGFIPKTYPKSNLINPLTTGYLEIWILRKIKTQLTLLISSKPLLKMQ
jgi:hypothetical protein